MNVMSSVFQFGAIYVFLGRKTEDEAVDDGGGLKWKETVLVFWIHGYELLA